MQLVKPAYIHSMGSMFLSSRLLPVPHGFSTRWGGTSEAPFDSLNTGFSVGDARERVEENLSRLARAFELDKGELHTVSQVHGDAVVEAGPPQPPGFQPEAEADALWTGRPGTAVGVKTADCVPILLVDPRGKRVAAVHSGWKGTDLEIAARTVEALVKRGSQPKDLLVAIGPSIRACCYEVSEELAGRFAQKFGQDVVRREGQKPHLDLCKAIVGSLTKAGVSPASIDTLPECTACDQKSFFSHRRDQGRTGRHLSWVVCRFLHRFS